MTRRENDSANAVADYFDRQAKRFPMINRGGAHCGRRLVDSLFRRSLKLRFERTLSECDPISGRRVLDVGCGPGSYSIALARRGAERVAGIDVSSRMIELAAQHAAAAGVGEKCIFQVADLREFDANEPFDYVIVMGVMDYVQDAAGFITKVLSLTRGKALFSFPKRGGILSWQRRLRYRWKCPIFLCAREELIGLFKSTMCSSPRIERLARDWFVTCRMGDEIGSSLSPTSGIPEA